MMKYAVAYLQEDPAGFVGCKEPFVVDGLEYEEANMVKSTLLYRGLKKATVFWYEELLPKDITWSFVTKHSLTA